jgi:hypothetical protein
MNLDETAINAVKDYFDSISQNAIDIVYESAGSDTTFAEFMEAVNFSVNQLSSELVASEVLNLPAKAIENFNGGTGMSVEDVQEIIDSNGGVEIDVDDFEE